MKRYLTLTALASAALLAACGQPADKAATPAAEPAAAEPGMAPMAPAATADKTGHGTGVVTAIDAAQLMDHYDRCGPTDDRDALPRTTFVDARRTTTAPV